MIDLVERVRGQIAVLCRRYGVRRLDVFGSAATGNFNAGASDIDFFYEFDLGDSRSLADRFFGLQEELESLLEVPVDLISARDAKNPYFLAVANRNRQLIHAA